MLFNNRVTIERDSNNKKIEDSLFAKLAEIVQPCEQNISKQNDIKLVSVEDALKELLELEKTSQRG